MANKFNFVGTLFFNNNEDEYGNSNFLKTITKDSGTTKIINFMVKESKNNGQFISLMGWKSNFEQVIYTKEKDTFKNLQIKWEDRNKKDVLDNVLYSEIYKTNLGCAEGKTKQFLSSYEMVEYLSEQIPLLDKDQKLRIKGDFGLRPWKGSLYRDFLIKEVWLSNSDNSYLGMSLDLYYTKKSLYENYDGIEGRYIFDAFLKQYNKENKRQEYFPIQLVYDELNDGDIAKKRNKLNIKKKKKNIESDVVHMNWFVELFNGSIEEEVEEVEEIKLTQAQQEEVDLGLATKEDFAKKQRTTFSENINELRLKKYNLASIFSNGLVKESIKIGENSKPISSAEFEELIFSQEQDMYYEESEVAIESDDEDLVIDESDLDDLPF